MRALKNNKKIMTSWAMYDWANSVYSLVITSAIFPVYYTSITPEKVNFLGIEFINTALYSYAVSFSFLIIVFLSPILSGIADYSGQKKNFMKFFCYLGSISCAGLYFFDANNITFGIIFYIIASIGFAGSIVFYNAFLPEIASPDKQDALSAKGFSLGYIGSTILLVFVLLMIQFPGFFGIVDGTMPARIAFLCVAFWWAGFAQITFINLPQFQEKRKIKKDILFKGYKELKKVWKELQHQGNLKKFLLSFFFFNMSVQTVMYIATLFGKEELKLKDEYLIYTIFIIQIVAIAGAYLFSWISSRLGNIKGLVIAVIIWIGIGSTTYLVFDPSYNPAYIPMKFFAIAFVVGMVMGGIQSLSRSTYSKLLPNTRDHASYFSFFDVTEKISIVIGTFMYGYLRVITGSMRFSVLFFTIILIIGLIFLLRIKSNKVLNPIYEL